MLKIYKIDNYEPEKDHKFEYRRGYVIPFDQTKQSVLFVTDTDSAISHEKIGDDFVFLKKEAMKDALVDENFKDEEDVKKTVEFIEKIGKDYAERYKDAYPSTRKDYLLYEKNAIAFDESASIIQFGSTGRVVQFKYSDRPGFSYKNNPETTRIGWSYVDQRKWGYNPWHYVELPENTKTSAEKYF